MLLVRVIEPSKGHTAFSEPVARRRFAVLLLLAAGSAWAGLPPSSPREGSGRITLLGGYRWVPNWYLFSQAEAKGAKRVKAAQGGPAAQVGFGFMATDWLDVAVDLFAGSDAFELEGLAPFTAVTYGGLLGARLTGADVIFRGLTLYLGVEGGPTLAFLQSPSVVVPERMMLGFSVVGGFHWRLSDTWAFTFDARWLVARGFVTGVSGFNAGGVLFAAGVSYLFAPAPQRDLEVPGFGAPSRL